MAATVNGSLCSDEHNGSPDSPKGYSGRPRQHHDSTSSSQEKPSFYIHRSDSVQNHDSGLSDSEHASYPERRRSGYLTQGLYGDTHHLSPFRGSSYGSPIKPTPPSAPHEKPSPLRMCELDRHVISTPSQLLSYPVYELVRYLSQAVKTEVELAYVVYRWITCLGVKHQEETTKESEEHVSTSEQAAPTVVDYVEQLDKGRLKHADLFSILCKCANLETHKVSGRIRHYASQPSPQLCRARQASWSAILLKEGWGLIDCCLGARHWVSALRDRDPKRVTVLASSRLKPHFIHAPHNFYFLPLPEVLVTSHLPDNPCWQLLPHPVAEMDFFYGLLQTPNLHFMEVELVYPTSLKVRDIKEEAEVTWKLKGEEFRKFAFRLFCVSDDGLSHKDLTRYGFLETLHARGHARLRLIPPTSGRYVCELYGAHVPSRENQMTHLCSFDMDFAKTTSSALKFPENERVEWGPGAECLYAGLRPVTHEAGFFQMEKGQAQIVFACSKLPLVTQKLFVAEEEGSGKEIPYSTVNFRDAESKVRILLRIREAGDYILSVYAKDEAAAGKCQLVCNYLVLCESGLPPQVRTFPPVAYNKLGPTKAFTDFGVTLVCPRKSCIVVAPFSGKVLFAFTSSEEVELSCDLQLSGRGREEQSDVTDYVQHTRQEDETMFRARLPRRGDYLLHVYGKSLTGEAHKFLVYSAIVECSVPCKDCLPLAKVAPEWRSRVQILAPLRKCVVLGAATHFAVRVLKAKAVTVQGHRKKHQFVLESEDDEKDGSGGDTERTGVKAGDSRYNEEKAKQTTRERELLDKDTGEENDQRETPEKRVKDIEISKTQDDKGKERVENTKKADVKTSAFSDSSNLPSDSQENNEDKVRTEEKPKEEGEPREGGEGGTERDREVDGGGEGVGDGGGAGDGWQVWRCSVTATGEDEGSGLKLLVHDALSEGKPVCVAEFEVITERKMASKLEQQQAMWNEAEQSLRHRPDSGHRSDLDDEEAQVAYFLDDDIYASNPLGDENSDDSDNDSEDNDNEDEDDYEGRGEFDDKNDNENDEDRPLHKDEKSKHTHKQKMVKVDSVDKKTEKEKTKLTRQKTNANMQSPQRKRDKSTERKENARTAMMNKVYGSNPRTPARKKAQISGAQRGKTYGEQKRRNVEDENAREDNGKHASNKGQTMEKDVHSPDTDVSEGATERNLRRKLWKACQRRDREAIQKVVARYKRGGYAPCADLAAAERLLHMFELRDDLVSAIESKDQEAVRRYLTEVERNGYAGEMSAVCRKARALLSPHRVSNRRQNVAVEADMRTLLEIRSYRCPPEMVHHVIVAMLLLMGVHEGLTKKWSRCQRRLQVLSPQGVYRRMWRVKAESIHPEIAARAKDLLTAHSQEEAHNAGPGVVAIFKWCHSVIARVEQLQDLDQQYGEDDPVQPASRRRQRQIFREQAGDSNASNSSNNSSFSSNNSSNGGSKSRNEEKKRSVSRERKKEKGKTGVTGQSGNGQQSKDRNKDTNKQHDKNKDTNKQQNNNKEAPRKQTKRPDKSKTCLPKTQQTTNTSKSSPKKINSLSDSNNASRSGTQSDADKTNVTDSKNKTNKPTAADASKVDDRENPESVPKVTTEPKNCDYDEEGTQGQPAPVTGSEEHSVSDCLTNSAHDKMSRDDNRNNQEHSPGQVQMHGPAHDNAENQEAMETSFSSKSSQDQKQTEEASRDMDTSQTVQNVQENSSIPQSSDARKPGSNGNMAQSPTKATTESVLHKKRGNNDNTVKVGGSLQSQKPESNVNNRKNKKAKPETGLANKKRDRSDATSDRLPADEKGKKAETSQPQKTTENKKVENPESNSRESSGSGARQRSGSHHRTAGQSGLQKSPVHYNTTDQAKTVSKKEIARSRLTAATRRPKVAPQPVFHSTCYFPPPNRGAGTGSEEGLGQTDPRGQPWGSEERKGRLAVSDSVSDFRQVTNGHIATPDI